MSEHLRINKSAPSESGERADPEQRTALRAQRRISLRKGNGIGPEGIKTFPAKEQVAVKAEAFPD